MAGTNSLLSPQGMSPVVILVRPQLAENVGTTARAMKNCGFNQLRLVCPQHDWPDAKALSASSGADDVLEHATIHDSLENAISDLEWVVATSARRRDIKIPCHSLREHAPMLFNRIHHKQSMGLVFGPERTGLRNDDLVLCHETIEIPLNPAFCSLNLAQAVLLVCYELQQCTSVKPSESPDATSKKLLNQEKLASQEQIQGLMRYLKTLLDDHSFWLVPEKKPLMWQKIQVLLRHGPTTESDVNIMYGIFRSLTSTRLDRTQTNKEKS